MQERAEAFRRAYGKVHQEIGKVIVGHAEIVHGILTCLFVGGHALLEGVPGLGKTLLVRTLSQVLDLKFSRIQFTPDLMPSDVIGTNIITETPEGRREFRFQAGPIFAQIVLADEINRATPKTQSALLEAMQEHSVTVGGTAHRLDEPFLVMATQNRQRRTPSSRRGPTPCPRPNSTASFSNCWCSTQAGRRWR
jgi:MoxR-like ATPase